MTAAESSASRRDRVLVITLDEPDLYSTRKSNPINLLAH
jgi:hypothetical protein